MKIVCTSDLHGFLPNTMPEGDMLLVGGDICPAINHSVSFQKRWLEVDFKRWLKSLSFKHVVVCWGNHDFIGERKDMVSELKNSLPCHILTDEALEIEGLNIYGTPWQPRFFDWAFNLDEPELEEKWKAIPSNTDILLLHGPPYGFGDLARPIAGMRDESEHTGSPSLTKKIEEVKPKLVVYGHIHSGYGQYSIPNCPSILANVAFVNEQYLPTNSPMTFEV